MIRYIICTRSLDSWYVSVFFSLFLPAIFPIIFDCCTEVAHQVPRKWLRTVEKFDIQEDGGVCKISAVMYVVLTLGGKGVGTKYVVPTDF